MLMDIKLDTPLLGALRCFEAAGRLGSFTKAAEALHLTQSAISQQIRQLEARLGYPLFVRHARGLALTPKGGALHEATVAAFASLGRTLRQLSAPDAPLQVSCLPSFALQWLMPRLAEFHRLHPQTPVRLRAEFHAIDRETMSADDIDIAIRWDPFSYGALHVEPLFDESLVAAAAPAYLDRHPPRATAKWVSSVVPLHDASAWPEAPRYVEWRTWLDAVVPGYAGAPRGRSSIWRAWRSRRRLRGKGWWCAGRRSSTTKSRVAGSSMCSRAACPRRRNTRRFARGRKTRG